VASVELATAYISLVPSMKGAQGSIARELGAVDADGIGKDIGGRMGGGITGAMKSLVGPALAGLAAVGFGSFIKEAAAASDATDKFKATMSFAGMDTTAIDAAKNAAKSYADQTVYDLPTIQNMTAQLASNGVKDYTGLTQAAGNLNAVAGGNADTFKSVAMVMTQTAGAGKLTTENWNQMADAIPGAAGPLMKALEEAGAYTGNFRDAMADGQITSDEFNAALQKLGTDPVAVEAAKSTKTFEGAIGNLQATINSGLMSALDALKPAITGVINLLANGLGKAFAFVGNAARGLYDLFVGGDFTSALGKAFHVEEDSALVGFLFRIRDAFVGVHDVLFRGDFTGALTRAFNVSEDSKFVDVLFRIRDAALEVPGAFRAFGAAWKANDGDITSTGFAGVMERIANGAREVTGGISAMFAAFKAGGDEVTSSGFAGVMESIGLQARAVFDQLGPILAPLIPQFLALASSVSPLGTVFQAIQPMLPQLLDVFVQLAAVVGQSLGQAITQLLPIFVQLQGVFITVFQQVLATALPVVVQLVTMLGQTFAQLLPIIVPIITTLASMAATLIGQLMPVFMQLVSTVLPMVVTIFGAVLQAIGPLISTIAGMLIPTIQFLMPVVVTVFNTIAQVIGSVMQIVMGIIQVVTGIISGNWSQVWEGISNVFSGIWNTILAVVTGVLATIGTVVLSGLGLVAGFVSDGLGKVGAFFSETWNNVVNGVSGMIGKVTGFFGDIGSKITGAMGNVGSTLFSVGKNIVQGLIDGIGSMMGAIGRAVINIVPEAIRGPFESLLGIHSPSRVFRGYGVNIGQGLILGIGDMQSGIENAVTGMVTVPPQPAFAGDAAGVSAMAASGGFGGSMTLMVGGRAFDAYLTEASTATLQDADSNARYMRRGR
jgi:tape measure domain-containing protein